MGSLLSFKQVAAKLRVDVATVRREVSRGRLRALVIGERNLRVDPAELERYLDDAKRRADAREK